MVSRLRRSIWRAWLVFCASAFGEYEHSGYDGNLPASYAVYRLGKRTVMMPVPEDKSSCGR